MNWEELLAAVRRHGLDSRSMLNRDPVSLHLAEQIERNRLLLEDLVQRMQALELSRKVHKEPS